MIVKISFELEITGLSTDLNTNLDRNRISKHGTGINFLELH